MSKESPLCPSRPPYVPGSTLMGLGLRFVRPSTLLFNLIQSYKPLFPPSPSSRLLQSCPEVPPEHANTSSETQELYGVKRGEVSRRSLG